MPKPASWRKRPPRRPWSPDEDDALADMLSCGLAVEFWQHELPERDFGDILQRKLELVTTGQAQRAMEI